MQDKTQPERTWRLDNYVVWRRTTPFSPPTDIIELPDKLVVLLEIAGMRAGDFKVVLLDNRVIITGTREHPGWQNAAYHQVEIGYGDFRVEVLLPWSVEREDVGASYRDGFLEINLPRKPEMNIRIVDVQADDTHQQE
ncbi:MAG: Hsp20/alpha crystallin family protein [Chloroflexota bacterium]|nr:Hsp20/alpha crystallin family protein [Chloroflexota bacterium]